MIAYYTFFTIIVVWLQCMSQYAGKTISYEALDDQKLRDVISVFIANCNSSDDGPTIANSLLQKLTAPDLQPLNVNWVVFVTDLENRYEYSNNDNWVVLEGKDKCGKNIVVFKGEESFSCGISNDGISFEGKTKSEIDNEKQNFDIISNRQFLLRAITQEAAGLKDVENAGDYIRYNVNGSMFQTPALVVTYEKGYYAESIVGDMGICFRSYDKDDGTAFHPEDGPSPWVEDGATASIVIIENRGCDQPCNVYHI